MHHFKTHLKVNYRCNYLANLQICVDVESRLDCKENEEGVSIEKRYADSTFGRLMFPLLFLNHIL